MIMSQNEFDTPDLNLQESKRVGAFVTKSWHFYGVL